MHEIPQLDRQGLRQFGLLLAGFTAGVFGLALPWLWDFAYPLWPWLAGGVLLLWAVAVPAGLRLVYIGWMRLALLIGGVINRIVLAIVYFGVILPMGLTMRALGRDPLARRFDANAHSYRVVSKQPPKNHMERPF